jgi:hypothetical protein
MLVARRVPSEEEGGATVQPEQTVSEMAEEVLDRQAKVLVAQTGQPFQAAMEAVIQTEAGRQLRDLTTGEHRLEKAQNWQLSLFAERAEGRLMHLGIASENTLSRFAAERHYSWVENYMEWLEGKEARAEYHALLEEELASLRG